MKIGNNAKKKCEIDNKVKKIKKEIGNNEKKMEIDNNGKRKKVK